MLRALHTGVEGGTTSGLTNSDEMGEVTSLCDMTFHERYTF